MIRKFFYTLLIVIALIWGSLKFYEIAFGQPVDLMLFLPAALANIKTPPGILNLIGVVCAGVTALIYLIGMVNIYRHAGRDAWRAILYSVAILAVGTGLGLYQMQQMGLLDKASLNLIGLMIVPFLPPFLLLPLRATFGSYLAKTEK